MRLSQPALSSASHSALCCSKDVCSFDQSSPHLQQQHDTLAHALWTVHAGMSARMGATSPPPSPATLRHVRRSCGEPTARGCTPLKVGRQVSPVEGCNGHRRPTVFTHPSIEELANLKHQNRRLDRGPGSRRLTPLASFPAEGASWRGWCQHRQGPPATCAPAGTCTHRHTRVRPGLGCMFAHIPLHAAHLDEETYYLMCMLRA